MSMRRRWPMLACALALALCGVGGSARAADYIDYMATTFPIPDKYELVNDVAGTMLIRQQTRVREKLQALEKRNGTQIVFLSVPNAGEEGAYAYGRRVLQKWDIGNNGQANGVLFLVGDKDSHIFTGPGIAGAIPDVVVARILRDIVEPAARRDQLAEGIEAAIDALIKASHGEETHPTFYDYAHPYVPRTPQQVAAWVLGALAVLYALALLWQRRRARLGSGT
jgi:uncharacterized membrane protein YgcG